MSDPVIQINGLSKSYGGLRPLRLARFSLLEGDRVALAGFDATTAEVFVNLVTGATLPEEGTVRIFGRATSDIADSTDWLATVDRFGLVSERIVLLDQYSAAQNVAMSLTLDIDPAPPDVSAAVEALGWEVGLTEDALLRPVQSASAGERQRVRLARAIAANPTVLILEHPLAGLAGRDAALLAADLARLAERRALAVVVLAADADQARPFARRVLQLNGGTGALTEARGGLLGRLFRG
jgi:ABC-type transporter Mla maintaining outer membrane lipid asymmetry ATPase subunit MlaF